MGSSLPSSFRASSFGRKLKYLGWRYSDMLIYTIFDKIKQNINIIMYCFYYFRPVFLPRIS